VQKFWSILFGVVLVATLVLFIVSPVLRWWLPEDISTHGDQVDLLYYAILYLTGFFFVLTEAMLVIFLWRYIARPGRRAVYTHGNHRLEWTWTMVTAVILLVIAVAQINAWEKIKYQRSMPVPDHVFEVTARQFEWRLRYPSPESHDDLITHWHSKGSEPKRAQDWERMPESDDVRVVNEVHTWQGAKVRLYLKSRDVIHSFFLPNLRLKQDALPGKTIPVWFEATQANIEWDAGQKKWKPLGSVWSEEKKQWVVWDNEANAFVKKDWVNWELACAELCGWGHSKMQGRLFVHRDRSDYLEWLRQAQSNETAHQPTGLDTPPEPAGNP